MASDPETLFKPGATYVVLRDEAALRDNFVKGQRLVYWRHAYSFYDGLHGWFFYDENQKVLAWDKPEVDPKARDALFAKFESTTKPSPQSIFIACKTCDVEGLRVALNEGIAPAMVRRQAFEFACQAHSIGCMLLLAGLPGVDEEELGDFLRHAATEGFTSGVQALLDEGIPVNATDRYGQTALIHAVWGGDIKLVDLLLARGADPTLKMTTGNDALAFAQSRHHEVVATRLTRALERGNPTHAAAAHAPSVVQRQSPLPPGSLLSACKKDDERAAREALNHGNISESERRDAFDAACRAPSFACVSLLSQQPGIDVAERCRFLLMAAEAGYTPGVQTLLKAGVPIDATDDHGQTALFHAAANGDLELLELLLYRGANLTRQNDEGRTALDAARECGRKTVIKRLEEVARKQNVTCPKSTNAISVEAVRSSAPVTNMNPIESTVTERRTDVESGQLKLTPDKLVRSPI
ncbi:MAG: ankyrin repeat domain-containing protein [Polyangiaceae bacterium]